MDNIDKIYEHFEELRRKISAMQKKRFEGKRVGENMILSFIIKYTNHNNAPPMPSQLSSRMMIAQATITPIINKLEDRGYIIKESDRTDRRARYLHVTPEGLEAYKTFESDQKLLIQEYKKFLGEEDTKALLRILEKSAQFLDCIIEDCKK